MAAHGGSGWGSGAPLARFSHGAEGSDSGSDDGDADLLDLIGQHDLSMRLEDARARRELGAPDDSGSDASEIEVAAASVLAQAKPAEPKPGALPGAKHNSSMNAADDELAKAIVDEAGLNSRRASSAASGASGPRAGVLPPLPQAQEAKRMPEKQAQSFTGVGEMVYAPSGYGQAFADQRGAIYQGGQGYAAQGSMMSVRSSAKIMPGGGSSKQIKIVRASAPLSKAQICIAVMVALAAVAGAFFGGLVLGRRDVGAAPTETVTTTLIVERNVTNNVTHTVVERLPTPAEQASRKVSAIRAQVTTDGRLRLDIGAVADFPGSSQTKATKDLMAASLGSSGGELNLAGVVAAVVETKNADGSIAYTTKLEGQTKFQNVDVQVSANMSTVNGELVVVMVGRPAGEVNLADAIGANDASSSGSGFNASSIKFNPGVVMVFTNGVNGTVAGLTITASIDAGADQRLNTVLQIGAAPARRRRLRRRLGALLRGDDQGALRRALQAGDSDALQFQGTLKPGLALKAPVDMKVEVHALLPADEGGSAGEPYITGRLVDPEVQITDEEDTYLLSGTMVFELLGHGADHPMEVPLTGKLYEQSFEISGGLPFWRGGQGGHGTLFQNITVHVRGARIDLSADGEGAVDTAAIAEMTAVVDLGVQRLNLRWPLTMVGQEASQDAPAAVG